MNWILALVVCLHVFCCAEEEVVELSGEEFDKFIADNPVAVVELYSPGCGHCKKFAPTYEKLAKHIKDTGRACAVGKVDDRKYKKSQGLRFSTYPGLVVYVNGTANLFKGELEFDPVLAYIDKKLRPPSTELSSEAAVAEAAQRKSEDKPVFILSFEDPSVVEQYNELARKYEDFDFYHAKTGLVKKQFPKAESGTMIVIGYGDEKLYSEKLNDPKAAEFIELYSTPPVQELDSSSMDAVNQKGKHAVCFFYDNSKSKCEELKTFKKAAVAMRSAENVFITANIDESWGSFYGSLYSITPNALPLIEVFESKDRKTWRYRFDGEFTEEAIAAFVAKAKRGEVERYIKSEPEPTSNSGPIRRVVGRTFNREVLENDKDVVVVYYGPECPKCDKVKAIFVALNEKWKEPRLVFAELDITKNDAREHYSQIYPVIELFPGKNKTNVRPFDNPFTESEIQQFIEKESSYIGNKEKSDL